MPQRARVEAGRAKDYLARLQSKAKLMLRKSLLSGAAAVSFGLLLGGSALAQGTPGQFTPDANAPIQLHMPVHLHPLAKPKPAVKKRMRKAAPAAEMASAPPAATDAAPISSPAATPVISRTQTRATPSRPATTDTSYAPSRAERRRAVQDMLNAPGSSSSTSEAVGDLSAPDAAIPFSFDTDASPPPRAQNAKPPQNPSGLAEKTKPAPSPSPAKPRPGAAAPQPRTDLAALTPPAQQTRAAEKPKGDPHAGLTKQGEILFDGSSTDPQAEGASALKASTDKLNAALDKGAANVEVEAYAGSPGDKSSEARRLSLRRALAVRQLLIDGGIPANRIVVKAEGGAEDQGNPQRVDVYLRGGAG